MRNNRAVSKNRSLIPAMVIERRIYLFRGEKVMIDSDLAALYGVETKTLNRAVKRNLERFPRDFMFKLNSTEASALRRQIGASNAAAGADTYLTYSLSKV